MRGVQFHSNMLELIDIAWAFYSPYQIQLCRNVLAKAVECFNPQLCYKFAILITRAKLAREVAVSQFRSISSENPYFCKTVTLVTVASFEYHRNRDC